MSGDGERARDKNRDTKTSSVMMIYFASKIISYHMFNYCTSVRLLGFLDRKV